MSHPSLSMQIFGLYMSGLVGVVVTGILWYGILGLGLRDRLSEKDRVWQSEGFPWWQVLLLSLVGAGATLAFWIFKTVYPADRRLEALAILMLGPAVGVIALAISGYLLLYPLGLKGFGQKFGIWMGIFFGGQAGETLVSYLGISLR